MATHGLSEVDSMDSRRKLSLGSPSEFDDDVPPLEDMSELLNRIEIVKKGQQQSSQTLPTSCQDYPKKSEEESNNGDGVIESKEQNSDLSLKSDSSKPSRFGGMKKGFLFGSSKGEKPKKKTENIPVIKPTVKVEDQHRIPEVQDALKVGQQFADNQDWVTDDLLQNIGKNESLVKKLQNPHFMQAITEFQTNSQAALTKYSGNTEMESFFKDFCGLLGSHFTNLSNNTQSPPPKPSYEIKTSKIEEVDIKVHNPHEEEDRKVRELLEDSEIREILLDADIRNLIEMLKNNPHEAQRILQRSSPDLKAKVSKLVDRGVLQFQR